MQLYMTHYQNYRSYSRPKSKQSMMTMTYTSTFKDSFQGKKKRGSEDSQSITYPSYMSTEKKIRT